MLTWDDVEALASELNIATPNARRMWRVRRVPYAHRGPLIEYAAKKGKTIRWADFDRLEPRTEAA